MCVSAPGWMRGARAGGPDPAGGGCIQILREPPVPSGAPPPRPLIPVPERQLPPVPGPPLSHLPPRRPRSPWPRRPPLLPRPMMQRGGGGPGARWRRSGRAQAAAAAAAVGREAAAAEEAEARRRTRRTRGRWGCRPVASATAWAWRASYAAAGERGRPGPVGGGGTWRPLWGARGLAGPGRAGTADSASPRERAGRGGGDSPAPLRRAAGPPRPRGPVPQAGAGL